MLLYVWKNNKPWSGVFLEVDPRLLEETRLEIILEAVDMEKSREKERRLEGANYQGILRTDRKYVVISCYGGHRYSAEIDTTKGKRNTSFILTKEFDPKQN